MKLSTKELKWNDLRDGTLAKHLTRNDEQDRQLDLMKLEPNTTFAKHAHPEEEWVYVLSGSFKDEHGEYQAGDFLLNKKGSRHQAFSGPDGAELIVFWCGRVEA